MKRFENNQGLNDLIEVIDFTFTALEALKAAKANDGKIDLKDFPLLFPILMSASPAVEGIANIPQSWAASSEQERTEVLEYFKTRFDLPDDNLEVKIEKLVTAAVIVSDVALNLK